MAVIFIGLCLCLSALVIPGDNDVAEELPAPKVEAQKPLPANGKFIKEIAAPPSAQHLRDPFRPMIEPPLQEKGATNAPKAASFADRSVKPRLAGIINGGDRAIALLEYQSESRACGVGEMVGPYRVTRILSRAAMLEGRGESFSLRVGR